MDIAAGYEIAILGTLHRLGPLAPTGGDKSAAAVQTPSLRTRLGDCIIHVTDRATSCWWNHECGNPVSRVSARGADVPSTFGRFETE